MAPLLRRTPSDQRAFERLYRRHARDVYRYSLAVLGDPADAEDVTQTTFLNAYRAFERGERPQKPENWLIAIAHNVCRQRFRQAQRRPREVEYADEVGGAVDEPDGPSVEDLRRAFSHLPPNQRAALVMRELEGRSYAEIAEVLGISVSALETLLFRARRALREQLEEQLTCSEAELAVSRQLDGRLSKEEQGRLRAHLRACSECARLAQSQRAQRRVLRTLLAVPLPPGLTSFFHPGAEAALATTAAATGTGVAVKAAAVVAGAALVGGGTYAGATKVVPLVRDPAPAHRTAAKAPAPRASAQARAVVPAVAASRPAAATPSSARGRGRVQAAAKRGATPVEPQARGVVERARPTRPPATPPGRAKHGLEQRAEVGTATQTRKAPPGRSRSAVAKTRRQQPSKAHAAAGQKQKAAHATAAKQPKQKPKANAKTKAKSKVTAKTKTKPERAAGASARRGGTQAPVEEISTGAPPSSGGGRRPRG